MPLRCWSIGIVRVIWAVVALGPAGWACGQGAKPLAHEVAAVKIVVSDLDASERWYTQVLHFQEDGAEREVFGEEHERLEGVFGLRRREVRLRLGDEAIELTEPMTPAGLAMPADSRSNDHWFQHIAIIVSDMDRAYAELRTHDVTHASTGPQTLPAWNKNAGGIKAFYFKDPDNHVLEILQFPSDKGNPKWHEQAARMPDQIFLGIDHTAIVVSDTDRSLKFYRDVLGFTVAGGADNYGPEQEHLNNVFGAHLRITSLKPPRGPSIEFLEYLTPGDGRPYPEGARTQDIFAWQTVIGTHDLDAVRQSLRECDATFVSTDIVTLPGAASAEERALIVRDPDGHFVRIGQK